MLIRFNCNEHHPMNESREEINLKMLDRFGFTFNKERNLISIAGIIILDEFCMYDDPVSVFDQLLAGFEEFQKWSFDRRMLAHVDYSIEKYYGGDYYACRRDLDIAKVRTCSLNNYHVTRTIKRHRSVVAELELNGINSDSFKYNSELY